MALYWRLQAFRLPASVPVKEQGVKTKPDSTPICLTPPKPNSVLSDAHMTLLCHDPTLKVFFKLSR